MRFQVPQFIEMEDKIFGPLTFKQFVYVAGGGGIVVLLFFFLPTFLAILVSIPVGGFAVALAFYEVNKRPFIVIAESAFKHFFKKKLYVWKKESEDDQISESVMTPKKPNSSQSLKDKTFMLGLEKEGENIDQ